MRDKDIIKALECCTRRKIVCIHCPLQGKLDCKQTVMRKTLRMLCLKEAQIEAQKVAIEIKQAEIEKLKEEKEEAEKALKGGVK